MKLPKGDFTVIVAAGDFPSAPQAIWYLNNAKIIVACDSAAANLIAHNYTPDFIVGDMDSLDKSIAKMFQGKIYQEKEQETNDLSKAFRFCLKNKMTKLVILGATGKREDHTLGNLALLADYATQVPDIKLVTDYGTMVAINKSTVFQSYKGQQISIFSLDSNTAVSSKKLKYPLDNLVISRWWQATLNEALENSFELLFQEGKTLLIFLEH